MISHRCPHGNLYSCPVCEFGELCGFLELELGGSGSVERTNVFYFECGPRRPRSLAGGAEGLLSDAERSSAALGYLGHPPEEDLCPEVAWDFVLSEAIKEKVLARLLRALSALPVPERPVSLTLFAWGSKEDSPDSRPASSWVAAFLSAEDGEILGAVRRFGEEASGWLSDARYEAEAFYRFPRRAS